MCPNSATAASAEDAATDAASDAADTADATLDASTDDAEAIDEPDELCSGCSDEDQDGSDMSIHLHHVHMNVSDRAKRIELWSGGDARVNHVHFTTADLPTTLSWYQDFLGIDPGTAPSSSTAPCSSSKPTASPRTAWRARAEAQGIEIVSEPAETHGFQSFFVRGPDGLLIELVQASPSPGLCE